MNKYLIATVKPTIDVLPNTAFDSNDLLFDWFRFEIPTGAVHLRSVFVVSPGTNATAGNTHDMNLVFATSLNGSAILCREILITLAQQKVFKVFGLLVLLRAQ
jgi:hypothetical protein